MSDLEVEVAQLLEAAGARLDATGWCKNKTGAPCGPNCLEGALLWCSADLTLPREMRYEIREAACEALASTITECELGFAGRVTDGTIGSIIVDWNDDTCADAVTAADMLRRAAKEVFREKSSE